MVLTRCRPEPQPCHTRSRIATMAVTSGAGGKRRGALPESTGMRATRETCRSSPAAADFTISGVMRLVRAE